MRVYCYMRVGTKEQLEETPARKEPVKRANKSRKKRRRSK